MAAVELAAAVGDEAWSFLLEGMGVTERVNLGRFLAESGDSRPGVGCVLRDGRRIPDIVWGEEVPAGTYPIGGDEEALLSFVKRAVVIPYPYRLSRFPVTYAQFQCFLDAPDFDDDRWWVGMPTSVKDWNNTIYSVRELGKQAFPFANHPRERVSWYQATAFCRWLSHQLGYIVELPHEYEWEAAARWPDNRFYPWGNEFAHEKANSWEGSVGSTTAVGLYPTGGNVALELYDLSGNVWEWCRNKYEPPYDDHLGDSVTPRVLRGGSWGSNSHQVRAAYRDNGSPANRLNGCGFRLVVVRHPSSH